jgi:hypothetical protein
MTGSRGFETALVTRWMEGEMTPALDGLCDDRLAADRFWASNRQHPVQDRRADSSLGLVGSEAAGS